MRLASLYIRCGSALWPCSDLIERRRFSPPRQSLSADMAAAETAAWRVAAAAETAAKEVVDSEGAHEWRGTGRIARRSCRKVR